MGCRAVTGLDPLHHALDLGTLVVCPYQLMDVHLATHTGSGSRPGFRGRALTLILTLTVILTLTLTLIGVTSWGRGTLNKC